MNIYEACPEVENGSFLLYIPHINDRLAHRPQMVYGWLDSLPPALVRVVLHAVNQNLNDCRGQSYLD